jgi:hypothetical protein
MRLLTLSNEGAIFYRLKEGETLQQAHEAKLERDKEFPVFTTASLGKFAPYSGSFAVIVDDIGIHFIDTQTGKESRLIVKTGVTALEISPRDSYLITCDKFQ